MKGRSKKHELVIRAIDEAPGPMSANELWDDLRGTGIGIATVYRALKQGVEDGILTEVELQQAGPVRYERTGLEHHHHFLCSVCERVFDLIGCVGDLDRLLPGSFRMSGHEVLIFGTCSGCEESR